MNEGSVKQPQGEERVPPASSKTLPLNLAKMYQLTRDLAKDATSCDVLVANPRCTGSLPKSPPVLATPKFIFPGASVFYGREAEGRLRAAPPCGTFWASLWWEGLRQPLCTPEDSMSCSATSQWPSQLLIKARFSCLSEVGHTRRQEVRPDAFTSLIRSCLLTVRLTFTADKDISDLSTCPNKTSLWWEL